MADDRKILIHEEALLDFLESAFKLGRKSVIDVMRGQHKTDDGRDIINNFSIPDDLLMDEQFRNLWKAEIAKLRNQ